MEILQIHTSGARLSLSNTEWEVLLEKTDGYSGCDLANLTSSALLEPMRDMVKATHWVTTSCKYLTLQFNSVKAIPILIQTLITKYCTAHVLQPAR